jgi:hypothetical protein
MFGLVNVLVRVSIIGGTAEGRTLEIDESVNSVELRPVGVETGDSIVV